MKQTRLLMGMPITVDVVGATDIKIIDSVFEYFAHVEEKFSVYKESSEIMAINRGELQVSDSSEDMKLIFKLAEKTKLETDGYFDIVDRKGLFDPSGIVKGWSIYNAAKIIEQAGYADYFVDAGGDIQVNGRNQDGNLWSVGIKNPFKQEEIVKVVYLNDEGVATSGTYIRGQHIYDPKDRTRMLNDVVSVTVIGPNVYEADRFATPAFAMGPAGIDFIERLTGFEGYMIDSKGIATMTSGFERYLKPGNI